MGAKTPERVPTTTEAAPGANAAPLVGALGIAEGAVQDRDAIAEAAEELAGDGGRQGDLRNQQQRAAAAGQRGVDGVQIHLGLAGTGDAVQQERAEFVRLDGGADLRRRRRLATG